MTFSDSSSTEYMTQWAEISGNLRLAEILINQMRDAALCLDRNTQLLYVNDATCRITEYSRKELLAMRLQDLDINFSVENWYKQWQILKQQRSLNYQSYYRTKSGRLFCVELAFTYVEAQEQELICTFVREKQDNLEQLINGLHLKTQQAVPELENSEENLCQEVFEYQKTEAELKNAVSLLRSTLESTANGILAVNFEGEILCYNQKFIDMWQLPDFIQFSRRCNRAKAFFENQVKDPEVFRKSVWEISSRSDIESYDLVELKDGRIFAHYSEPQRLGDKIIGRVWSVWDITEFRQTEEALKLNEARFRTLAETTDASIFLVSNRRICYVNQAAELLTGYTKKELLNNFDINKLIKSTKLRQIQKHHESADSEYQEIQILTKYGTTRWLACTLGVLNRVMDFADQSVELMTAIDITDYKQAESELRQTLEQAKKLSELRARFVMFCHQFRTPLNIVSFSADLLRRHIHQWTEEKNRSYLDLIQVAVNQISELLDEILLYSKAEASKLVCQPRSINLEQFCHDIITQVQLASGNQKLIHFVSYHDCSNVHLDPKLLQHILTNLLTNAMKYSSNDSRICFEVNHQNDKIIFQIKDMGIGIPLVDQSQIFEPFYRGSNVDKIPGTGLGLSIVKTLVDLHEGQISVDSKIGFGTVFTVTLPSI